jgi:hypothetical protein
MTRQMRADEAGVPMNFAEPALAEAPAVGAGERRSLNAAEQVPDG